MEWNSLSTENNLSATDVQTSTGTQGTPTFKIILSTTLQSNTDREITDSLFVADDFDRLNQLYLVLTCIILVIGSVGNLMVIGAVISHRRLSVRGNVFIVNLAVADFIVSFFINTASVVALVTNGEYFMPNRPNLCELVAAVCVITCVCSVWSIASISVNRYIRICHHKIYFTVYTKQNTALIVAGLWLCCFLIDLPNIIGGWGKHGFDTKLMMCTYDHRLADYSSTVFFILLGFVWPWIVTVYAYLRIFLFVRKKSDALRMSQNSRMESGIMGIGNADVRLLRSTFTIFVLFFIMWAPYATIVLFDPPHNWPLKAYVVAGFFAHTNSSINSIMYAVTNKHFRDGYISMLRCGFRGGRVATERVILQQAAQTAKNRTSNTRNGFLLTRTNRGNSITRHR